MANNQKKLKAFVRYDGSGRVVASSLILRKNKPRVGRWYEIPEYLCCNGAPSSTTTTTTNGGGVTPTAFIQSYWSTPELACNSTADGTLLFYSSSSTLEAGIEIFEDAALTIRVPYGYVIYLGPSFDDRLEVSAVNGLLTELVCPAAPFSGNVYYGDSAANACSGSPSYGTFFATGNGTTFCNSTQLTSTSLGTIPLDFIIYVSYGGQVYTIIGNDTNTPTATSSCVSCG